MKYLAALTFLLIPTANAATVTPLFGTQNFTPDTLHTVTGPLVQLQTEGGTTLSFQQGARFPISTAGTVTLHEGNLRVGPAGTTPLQLNLPQGPITVAPLTALTVTAQPTQTSGRIYQGNLTANDRTFTTGEGFLLTPSGAHGTFTPAPAQAPALVNLDDIAPAAGPLTATPPTTAGQPILLSSAKIRPTNTTNPTTQPPITEEPVTQPTQPEPELPTTPTPEPEPELPTIPEPETPVIPTIPTPQPEPEPITELPPTPITRSGLYAAWSEDLGLPMPTNKGQSTGEFSLTKATDGTQYLEATQTKSFPTVTTLSRGTALNLDATSHGSTSGLGRWVGGELVATITNPNDTTTLPLTRTTTTYENPEAPTITPKSLHYVWGEKPTAIPTSGRLNYTLFSATQPTYTGTTLSSEGATFNGNLAIDFKPGFSGKIGTYHLNGTVTMPEVTQTETGPTTTNAVYTLSTATTGAPLVGTNFGNISTLNVTATPGATACPNGCSGTVNAAAFGVGAKDAGILYAINPTGPVGITGAAIFTSAP